MSTVPAAGAAAARSARATPSRLEAPELAVATKTTPSIATASPATLRREARSPKSAQPAAARTSG
jgi:hypothetical protein